MCNQITCSDCDKPADPENGKGLCTQCNIKDCDEGIAQALEMADNMRKYGTIDKPTE